MAKQPLTVEVFYSAAWNALALADDQTVNKVLSVAKPIEIGSGRSDEVGTASPIQTGAILINDDGVYNPRNPASPLYGATGRNAPARIGLGTPHVGAAASSLSASVSHVAPSVVAPTASGILLCGWSGPLPAGSYTAPGDMTESLDQSTAVQTMMVARKVNSGAGATGTKTATISTSETWLAASVLIHGPVAITTGGLGGDTLLTIDGNAGDWWILFSSFGWDAASATPVAFPWDTDGGGWVVLADTGTVFSNDGDAPYNRMRVWAKQVKVTNSAHTVGVESVNIDSTISYMTRIPAAEIDSVWSMRMHGEVSSWSPKRALHAHGLTGSRGTPLTDVDIAGITRRLTQGVPPVRSALHRTVFSVAATLIPLAYWPMSSPSPLTPGAPNMAVADITGSSSPDLSWVTGESRGGDVFSSGGRDIYVKPTQALLLGANTNAVADSVLIARPTTNTSAFTLSHRIGDFFVNVIGNWATGVPTLTLTSNAGTLSTAAATTATRVWDEAPHAWRTSMTQNGANIDISVYLDGIQIFVASTASTALTGSDRSGFLPGLIVAGRTEATWGPVIAWTGTAADPVDTQAAGLGYPGETAGRRFIRVCAEAGIACAVVGDPDDTQFMGPQYADSLITILREVEATDGALMYDGRTFFGLVLRTGRSMYNQAVALALDYEAFHVAAPFDPIVDDLFVHNDVTATRRQGATAQVEQASGPMNVNEPADDTEGVGRYAHQVDVNPWGDDIVGDIASWHLHRGTVDETRWPNVTIDLDATPNIARAASVIDPGDYITIDNHPDSPDLISLIAIGAVETIESHQRKITFTCVPERPFHIATVAHTTYRIIGSSLTYNASTINTTQTAITFTIGEGPDWVFETAFDVIVNGERMTVTAIAAAAGTYPARTQAFTVTRSVNGVVKSHAANSRLRLFSAAYIGL